MVDIYFFGTAFDYKCAVYLFLFVRNLKQSETAAQSIQSIRSLSWIMKPLNIEDKELYYGLPLKEYSEGSDK